MPLLDLQRRLRELGRIRLGAQVAKKGGGTRPTKLDRFRFTSPSKDLIEAAAALYGGEAKAWDDAPGDQEQWQVFSTALSINAIVPPGSYMSQDYEMWSGGGCQRRCDGETEMLGDRPCMCPEDPEERRTLASKGEACKPTTRLSLILPELPDIGVWRLESHGFYAAIELAGAQQICSLATARGQMLPVRLRLEGRERKRPGQPTLKFSVPVLELSATFGEVLDALNMGGSGPLILAPTEATARPELMATATSTERLQQLGTGHARPGAVDFEQGMARVAAGPLERPPARGSRRRSAAIPGDGPPLGDSAFHGAPDEGEARAPVPNGDVMPGAEEITARQIKALQTLASKLGWSDAHRHERAGVSSFKDLSKERAGELIDDWQTLLNDPAEEGPVDPIPPSDVPGAEKTTLAYGEGVNGSDSSPGTTVEPPGVAHPPGELDATSTAVDSGGGGASTEGHAPTSDGPATPELWREAMEACDIWTPNKILSEFVKVFQPEHSVSVAELRGSDLRRLIEAKTNQEALG